MQSSLQAIQMVIVHNGIIENFALELKSNLQLEGFTFESDTDTEVIANYCRKIMIHPPKMP